MFKRKSARGEIVADNDSKYEPKSNKELVRTIASNWKRLEQDDREHYEKKAEVYLIEYRKQMEKFQMGRQHNEK